ncbi:VC0807 family protein [Fluviispira vulneris]|uniref:VC0807 family protein n=1 Tax=Fluviispira vulneris TaxID=2763012 RepID=UPI0016476216|nr:VC0807 family protein [Fluviispira vulneris]
MRFTFPPHNSQEINAKKVPKPKENLFISIIFNVIIPFFILNKMSSTFGAVNTFFIALAFPLIYAVYDLVRRKQLNPISILAIVSIVIKGIFVIYKVDGFWFAVKEAAIPSVLGIITIVSVWIGRPLINYFIYNENIFNIELLESKLKENNSESSFKKLIWQVTFILGFAFFLGGILNFFLALNIIVSPAGTESFNKEIAEMTWKGYLVVALPKTLITIFGLWWFIKRLKVITGLEVSKILKTE